MGGQEGGGMDTQHRFSGLFIIDLVPAQLSHYFYLMPNQCLQVQI